MGTYVPLGNKMIDTRNTKHSTAIMSILNTTPDSFSDGGLNPVTDKAALESLVAKQIDDGATIIDIGGQSSRPHAPEITAEEEISRILPAIEAVRSLPAKDEIAISVDTYRASVAQAAIDAGAHIINDISAGLLDEDMLPTIAKLGCTYIMMHMRGNPHTMQNHTSYQGGLVSTVASELRSRVDAAHAAGIRRWRIVLDPGVGFAKTQKQNLELLRCLSQLRLAPGLHGFPWLVGTSRKGFIGKITGVKEARDRIWGTAATVTAAVQGGADIVRVHDVKEMAHVVRMADAIYRC
ncbi:Dihydropteroate synthase [Piedraia hortae CBS 480.64]|uniref:Folic acid synthesis protein FOL1 n=1 Tax=Piedraia hortae CBS 480.64 TaxID=1314780 RepID=A0A6A7CAB7_9PEZI|nr:Dihydropteroate synthase [Piedraia hortae CBS 480.64]